MPVAAENNHPVLEVIGDRSVDENSLLSFTLTVFDMDDDDGLLFSASGLPVGSYLNTSSGLFVWTPTYNQSGIYRVQFTVSDGSRIDSEYISINVNDVNRPPVFSPIEGITTNEGQEVIIILQAWDPDDDLLVFSKDSAFGKIKENIFTWTPDYDDHGENHIVFTVSDGLFSTSQTAIINVSNVNRGPVLYSIGDTSASLNESITIQLKAFDPDEDHLYYSNVSALPPGASLDHDTGLFQWPDPDSLGVYILTFEVDDGLASYTKTARIVIGDSNSPPFINPIGMQYVDENSELSFQILATDPDNDVLSFSYPANIPTGATVTWTNSSSVLFKWTPTYEQAGSYKVEFGVSDNSMYRYSSYEVVDIVVTDVNRPPLIHPINDNSVSENSVLHINLSATDPDGDYLTFSSNSSIGIIRGNTFIFTPGYYDAGIHNIMFTVSDGSLSDSTNVTIMVSETNMPPKISPFGPFNVSENKTLEFYLSVYDGDKDDILTYMAIDLPSGAYFNTSAGHFRWTPSAGNKGYYSVGFYVSDGQLDDYETIAIIVTEPSSSTQEPASSSGGGGGGSMSAGEKYENVDFKDYAIKSVIKDTETTFNFYKDGNSIVSVSFTSKLNGGQVKAVVEMLKDTSSLVSSSAPGTVYKNLNIWVGDSKFGTNVLLDIAVNFKVEKSWLYSNDLDFGSVELYRYSGSKWVPEDTYFIYEDEDYFYYEAKCNGFSSFAITVPATEEIIVQDDDLVSNETRMSVSDEFIVDNDDDVSQNKKRSLIFILLIGIISAVVLAGIKYRGQYEKLYMQIGNPDGKRYRRIKK
ncbi:MAG: PGF-pre-PGF domain-containing protein [Methanolobus sp.]|nr:PGF-pre-PGF domain-containing protein [Methanolobus sp.]